MNLIELLFRLIQRFVVLPQGRHAELQNQAEKWVAENKDKDGLVGKLLKYQNLWYVQLILCFVFLFMIKSISRWMLADSSDDEDDEDSDSEESDYEEYKRHKREQKMKISF